MKVEVYYFNIHTLDPWCCKIEEVTMTEAEFEDLKLKYCEDDDMYYSSDETIGYYVLEY